jgi:hypothetical protein
MKYRHFRHSDQQTIIDLPFLPDYASTGHGTVQAIGHLILSRRGHTAFPEFPTQILHRCHQKKLVAISPYTPKRAMTGAQQWNRAPAESVSTSLLFFFYQAENAKKSKSPSPTLATVACARSVIFLCNVQRAAMPPHWQTLASWSRLISGCPPAQSFFLFAQIRFQTSARITVRARNPRALTVRHWEFICSVSSWKRVWKRKKRQKNAHTQPRWTLMSIAL